MAPTKLLGPPQIYLDIADFTAAQTPPPASHDSDRRYSDDNPVPYWAAPPMKTRTENGSATFAGTGNPCLDFFFHIVPDTPREQIEDRVALAWAHDPLKTLKLICNLRGVRGTGKSDKEGFYAAALWLHRHHPKTLACNVKPISDFGYFKDMLEILYRILEGHESRKRDDYSAWRRRRRYIDYDSDSDSDSDAYYDYGEERKKPKPKPKPADDPAKSKARLMKSVAKAKKGLDRYNEDEKYRFLHESVSDFFAEMLRADMELYNSGQVYKISLASKWCPTLDSSYDRSTLMCESIARKLFTKDGHVEYKEMEDKHYAYRVRDRLRKEVLVPLHKALELPEIYICANKWEELPYKHVASVAMKNYKRLFYKHDSERFKEYLEKVVSGKATIAAGALLPHEIIGSLNDRDGPMVAELQWKRMVDDLAKKGKLTNCMAICDVSGSMSGIPMEVSVALGLLISELSEEPWKGKLITFSSDPQLQIVKGDSLVEKTNFIRRMEWGGNTDFQKVFDGILEVAVAGKLKEEQMIKRLFVFSDMEFDQASGKSRCRSYSYYSHPDDSSWETDYEVIKQKYLAYGYEKVPEIVFWNLRNSKATPVTSTQPGVALVSGYSKNLMTMFLDGGGIIDPEAVMEKAISGEEYQKLVVFD